MNTVAKGIAISGLFAQAACGGSGGGGGQDDAEQFGFLSLGISDGPIHSAQKVCITFDEIELKGPGGGTTVIALDPAEKINLLEFQGSNAMPLLVNEQLPAGAYNWMRLGVDAERGSNGGAGDTGGDVCDGEASYIVMDDGSVHNLYVPSGAQTGLKLVGGYTVPINDTATLTAEFDLGKSLTEPPGLAPDVKLRPTIKLVNNNEVGTLTGTVANALAEAEMCQPSVYLFDDGVTPNPIVDGEEDPNDPIATAVVNASEQADGAVLWEYTIGFILAGSYEAAFTCDGETFVPEGGADVSIVAGETTMVDF